MPLSVLKLLRRLVSCILKSAEIQAWRYLIVLSCSFPEDIDGYEECSFAIVQSVACAAFARGGAAVHHSNRRQGGCETSLVHSTPGMATRG